MHIFQKRINYQGDLEPLLEKVCIDFSIGEYKSYKIVPIGYEDFNIFLYTNKGIFFIKIFGSFRDEKECSRYVDIIKTALDSNISHPKLYQSNKGYLYETDTGQKDRLIVMEYVDGNIFYELKTTPTVDEIKFIVKQAALINQINIKPEFIYDHWAITSLPTEYEEKKQYLSDSDKELIQPLVAWFNTLKLENIPHCFVHGDITKTNAMRAVDGKIYILDFAVSNWFPRIQELSVMLCDLFFDPDKKTDFESTYNLVLSEYQKYINLTEQEIKLLPNYLRLAHVMHVLLANYEKVVNGNTSVENEYFLNMGRQGLHYMNEQFGSH